MGENGAHFACMAQLAGNEGLPRVREEILVVWVEESVLPAAEQRLVRMHSGAVLTEQRLGHECRVVAVLHCVLLDRDPVGHAVIRHLESVCVAHVDLVLGWSDLMVGVLNSNPKLL
ncbi:unannotated protein [freshwater metagenome]|uniref:Unannotated protein n=1 Tax=freshwater metagenome TaxID=449393 RepID=A0A6J7CU23_9ZZZZ